MYKKTIIDYTLTTNLHNRLLFNRGQDMKYLDPRKIIYLKLHSHFKIKFN